MQAYRQDPAFKPSPTDSKANNIDGKVENIPDVDAKSNV